MDVAQLPRDAQEAILALLDTGRKLRARIHRGEGAWRPFPDIGGRPHPQRLALESEADILGYGGQAGGGKSDLLLGVAQYHWRGIIFRRVFPSNTAMIDRSRQIYNPDNVEHAQDFYNEALHRWRFDNGGILYFGSLQYEKDVLAHQGQPRDYLGFDELTEFTEYQFRFVTGWNRTTRRGQRCRVIATMNPPTTAEGRWVVRYFAPWLDDTHPNPARPGELRWFTTIGGKDVECVDGTPFLLAPDGSFNFNYPEDTPPERLLFPKSRTFIFASVQDNPVLVESGYVATLQALPEPLRSILLLGDFKAGMEEDPWCVIPSAWVRAAQARWEAADRAHWRKEPMDQVGVDVARGGRDRTVVTPRHGPFVDEQRVYPGHVTRDGPQVVQAVIKVRPQAATRVVIDAIGVGSSPVDFSRASFRTTAFNGSASSDRRSRQGNLHFVNERSAAFWNMRELLDPSGGMDMMLPPDPELLSDLCAFKWELTPRGIKVESKDDDGPGNIKGRLGRSPDKGDSAVYAAAQPGPQGGGNYIEYMRGTMARDAAREGLEREREEKGPRTKGLAQRVREAEEAIAAAPRVRQAPPQRKRSSSYADALGSQQGDEE